MLSRRGLLGAFFGAGFTQHEPPVMRVTGGVTWVDPKYDELLRGVLLTHESVHVRRLAYLLFNTESPPKA